MKIVVSIFFIVIMSGMGICLIIGAAQSIYSKFIENRPCCTVCGCRFIPRAKEKYLIFEKKRMFECFDCPRCGCQNVIHPRGEIEIDRR